jgi:ribosomal protein S18 acetylase RimI-like enzyme
MVAPPIVVRQANEYDAATVGEVHRSSVRTLCASRYSVAQLAAWFEDRPPNMYLRAIREQRVWVATEAECVLGFLEIRPAEIEKLFVRPAAVHRGIGSRLLHLGITQARSLALDAITALALLNAQAFYERYGFTKVGESEILRGRLQLSIKVVRMLLS